MFILGSILIFLIVYSFSGISIDILHRFYSINFIKDVIQAFPYYRIQFRFTYPHDTILFFKINIIYRQKYANIHIKKARLYKSHAQSYFISYKSKIKVTLFGIITTILTRSIPINSAILLWIPNLKFFQMKSIHNLLGLFRKIFSIGYVYTEFIRWQFFPSRSPRRSIISFFFECFYYFVSSLFKI